VSVQAATKPNKISPVSTAIVGRNVRISWAEPYNRGDPIQYYTITIRSKTGDFYEDTTNCEGTDLLVRVQRFCDVPLLALRANPYDLLQGDAVAA